MFTLFNSPSEKSATKPGGLGGLGWVGFPEHGDSTPSKKLNHGNNFPAGALQPGFCWLQCGNNVPGI